MPVTGFDIRLRRPLADSREFGQTGAYEELKGTLHFAIDPEHTANACITDVKLAPRNADGLVEFSADIAILLPVDRDRGNGRMLLDIVNRGNRVSLPMFNLGVRPVFDADSDPDPLVDPGNGFLMRHGYTVVSCGWQKDTPDYPGLIRLYGPDALGPDGGPITGRIYTQLQSPAPVDSFKLSDRDHLACPAVDMDEADALLTVRDMPDLEPETVPRDEWRFGRYENGTYVADPNYVCMESGFEKGRLYQITYTTTGARVLGLGFAALRDCASWIKHGDRDAANPSAGTIDCALAYGISQTGRFLRTYLYNDANVDEEGREALDGVISHVAGGMRGEFNQRFGQCSKDRNQMLTQMYPFADVPVTDPETEETDSLLRRMNGRGSKAKVFFTNSSAEYHRGDASLLHTDPDGRRDVPHGPNTRIYHFTGTQHGLGVWPPTDTAALTGDRARNTLNQVDYSPLLRVCLVNLERWVSDGVEPPPSRHPRVDDGTAVHPESLADVFDRIPGASFPDRFTIPRRLDFGLAEHVEQTRTLPPAPGVVWGTLVSAVDADGNEVAGITLPDVTVPLATHTGWTLRHPDMGGDRQLFVFMGATMPFPRTRADRVASADPRPSIEERYGSKDDYLARIRAAAEALAADGYMLEEDIDAVTETAATRWDWYANGR